MKTSERLLGRLGRWIVSDVYLLERIEIASASAAEGYARSVRIWGLVQARPAFGPWPDPKLESVSVRLTFLGAREIELRLQGAGPMQITGLSVDDVSDRQLEGLRYHVYDYEDAGLSFWCAEAHADLA